MANITGEHGYDASVPHRLLDAAELLLARDGARAMTVRDVLSHADVANASAVSYYFGGKAGLVEAVERRAIERVESARAETLDALLARHADPSADDLVRAYIAPIVLQRTVRRGAFTATTYTRLFEQPQSQWDDNGSAAVMRLTTRYIEATRHLLPQADDHQILWRWQCVTAQACWYALGYLDIFAEPDEAQVRADLESLVRSGAATLLA